MFDSFKTNPGAIAQFICERCHQNPGVDRDAKRRVSVRFQTNSGAVRLIYERDTDQRRVNEPKTGRDVTRCDATGQLIGRRGKIGGSKMSRGQTWSDEEGCRSAKPSVNSSSYSWGIPGLRWVTGKERLFPVTSGRTSSPEKDAEEMEQPSDDYSLGRFSELEGPGRRPKPQWGENGHDRKLQRYKTQRLVTHLHRDTTHDPECHTGSENLSHLAMSVQPCLQKSLISHVPLRLQIKVNGQRGGLGICIAGGKGSLPYKENDEGVFISRVSKGGPAEKAGLHVGDRVLEVNGQDMQEVSHHEAVTVLRNAGSCIRMKVLRERCMPVEPREHERSEAMETDPQVNQEWDVSMSNNRSSGPQCSTDPMAECSTLTNRIEATVCNGNGPNEQAQDLRPMKDMETFKNSALQVVKNTMTIPRIILTHPSTSDEEVEPLTQGPDDGDFDSDFSDSDGHFYSDCLNNAFYPL